MHTVSKARVLSTHTCVGRDRTPRREQHQPITLRLDIPAGPSQGLRGAGSAAWSPALAPGALPAQTLLGHQGGGLSSRRGHEGQQLTPVPSAQTCQAGQLPREQPVGDTPEDGLADTFLT